MPSRRSLLASLGVVAVGGFAGCSGRIPEFGGDAGGPSPDTPPKAEPRADVDPTNKRHGATGSWSSPGCNAANTREVFDDRAPVDGAEVRWRVEVAQMGVSEPLAVDGTVFLPNAGSLRALDAETGELRWHHDEGRSHSPGPVVRDGRVHLALPTGLVTLDAESGEELWRREFPRQDTRAPGVASDGWLAVPVGETLHRIDPETGETAWSRRLFGQLLGPPAFWYADYPAVASEAGTVYLLEEKGTGFARWDLPAEPMTTVNHDLSHLFVNCRDGNTHALATDGQTNRSIRWSTEMGTTSAGLGVSQGLVAGVDNRELTVVDTVSGETRWTHEHADSDGETSDGWWNTAPAFARDTLFVGGDRLWALDPTPGGEAGERGPAVRWEKSFHGRVGPGPVLDDGKLFVVAQTDEKTFELLGLW